MPRRFLRDEAEEPVPGPRAVQSMIHQALKRGPASTPRLVKLLDVPRQIVRGNLGVMVRRGRVVKHGETEWKLRT